MLPAPRRRTGFDDAGERAAPAFDAKGAIFVEIAVRRRLEGQGRGRAQPRAFRLGAGIIPAAGLGADVDAGLAIIDPFDEVPDARNAGLGTKRRRTRECWGTPEQ